jgi:hypothetical protein
MVIRIAFVGLLFLATFYGLIQLALSSPLAKVRAVVRAVVKKFAFLILAVILTVAAMGFLSTVDRIF